MLYDASGVAKVYGVSALEESVQSEAEDAGWRMCKHWKLFLHPYIGIMSAPPPYSPLPPVSTTSSSSSRVTSLMSSMGLGAERHTRSLGTDGFELWPLPPGARVTVEKAYEDWLSYLVMGAKLRWGETDPDGSYIWNKLEETMAIQMAGACGNKPYSVLPW